MHVQCRMILEWSETLLHQISSEKETSGDGILRDTQTRSGHVLLFREQEAVLHFCNVNVNYQLLGFKTIFICQRPKSIKQPLVPRTEVEHTIALTECAQTKCKEWWRQNLKVVW